MLGDIRKLGAETVAYGLSSVVARLLNFILVPLYTHWLEPGAYGVVATVYSYIAVLNYVFQYGMDQAYLRHASDESSGGPERVFSAAFWPLLATSLVFALVMSWQSAGLAALGGIGTPWESLLRYAAWILALDALATLPFADLRLRHRVWTFVGVRSANIALNVAMNVFLVGSLGLGVRGVLLSSLIASAATLVLLASVLAERLRASCDAGLLRELLRFGLPLVPAGVGAMMVQVADRPILLRLMDEATVGLYQANARLAVIMLMLVGMFDQAWRPFFLERLNKPGSRELFARVFTYSMGAGILIAMGLAFFIGDLVRIPLGHAADGAGRTLIASAYWGGLGVVPVILAANVLHGAYINFMASVTISKKTVSLVWVTGLGALVSVAANFTLIPRFGMMGAAWAAFSAQAVMALHLYLVGQKVYPIPYERGRLLRLLAAAAASLGLYWGARSLVPSGWGWAACRLAALTAFPAMLVVAGFFDEDERAAWGRLLPGLRGTRGAPST